MPFINQFICHIFRMKNKAEIAAAISEKKKKEAELKNKQKAELSKMAYQRMIQTNEVFLTRFLCNFLGVQAQNIP